MRGRRGGLLARLVLATVVAGALAAFAGATVQARTTRATLRDEVQDRNAALAVELAARLDGRVTNAVELLGLVTTRSPILGMADDASQELRAVVATAAAIDELVLYDDRGDPVAAAASSFLADPAEEEPRTDLVERVRDGTVIEMRAESEMTMVDLAVAVESPPGNPIGALLGSVPLEVMAGNVFGTDPVLGTTRYLVTPQGQVVVHPERDRVLRGEQVELSDVFARGGAATREEDGERRLVAAAPSQTLDAAVVVEQSENLALAPVQERRRELTLILALAMAAAVLAIAAAGTWLLAPLGPLAGAVARLGRRERGVRVEVSSRGEVATLASEFNRLAAALDQRQDELDELQRLSLLVGTRTSRGDVAAEVARGARRLLGLTGVAVCIREEGGLEVAATQGSITEEAALRVASRRSTKEPPEGGDEDAAEAAGPVCTAIQITSLDGEEVGVVVVASERPLDEAARDLAQAYAAFAGVALENVRRLALEQQLAAELAEAVEQRRAMMSTVSHEFRTPLTCIDGFTGMLLSQWDAYDDDRRRNLVERIRHHSDDLSELVNRLLDFALTERGSLQAEMRHVDLRDAVEAVVSATQPLLEGREVEVDVDPVGVAADPLLLQRALKNLISNAVKYSPPGAPVRVASATEGARVRIEVVDQGSGLPPEQAARVFEPFWRSPSTAARAQRGSGLGLALVAEYARAMGGEPGLRTEPGQGSTFFLLLRRSEGL